MRFDLAATKGSVISCVITMKEPEHEPPLTCDGIILLPDDTAIRINEILFVKFQEDPSSISGS